MTYLKIIILVLLIQGSSIASAQDLTDDELYLYNLVMEYRESLGLPSIPLSPSLTFVAKTHVLDLSENNPVSDNCNAHSWSFNGAWSGCCYTRNHAQAECMWSKPKELTSYTGAGYEIAFWSSRKVDPNQALEEWKASPGHHDVIINGGNWRENWNAIGIGIFNNYAVIWFGHAPDKN